MSTDDDSTTEATFTRAQMAKMVNAQVKEKLAAALAEYGDLDELKAKAAEADTNRGKIDQVLDKLNAAEKRAADAELENTRRKVADKLGLTAREAGRLKGKSEAELLADGAEMIEDLGIDVEARKKGKTTAPAGKAGDGDSNGDGEGATDTDTHTGEDDAPPRQQAPARRVKPVEELRSGAPGARSEPEETDPMKLVANIPRR